MAVSHNRMVCNKGFFTSEKHETMCDMMMAHVTFDYLEGTGGYHVMCHGWDFSLTGACYNTNADFLLSFSTFR
jgi:hypothetical protein